MAKTPAHPSYLARDSRFHYICELNFLFIFYFSLYAIVLSLVKKPTPDLRDDSLAVFEVRRTFNGFLNGGSNL